LAPKRKLRRKAELAGVGEVGQMRQIAGQKRPVLVKLACRPLLPHCRTPSTPNMSAAYKLETNAVMSDGQNAQLRGHWAISEVKLAGGGASSAMAHKSNPVGAEVLVALGRFNSTLLAAQHQSLIHENERSGAAWTLEWLVLPQMLAATGAALTHASALCKGLRFVAAAV
jgi:3-carboxy-cis,cis-muconate cycloisomerase